MPDREKDNTIRSFTQADISISPMGTEDITVRPWQMDDTTVHYVVLVLALGMPQ